MNYFRTARELAGFTQKQVALELKVSAPTVSEWESGRKNPSRENLERLADLFGVSVDYLLGRDDDSQQSPTRSADELTEKEERDIEKRLEAMLASMDSESGLMFSGEPLDDETRELLAESLRSSMRMARVLAKKKYTPKKYRPEEK